MRTIEVEVTKKYTLQVDDSNHIVQEYFDDEELVNHLVSYNFEVLPVLKEGVKVVDDTIINIEID